MQCPSCGAPFSAPPAACPSCGLSLAVLDRKFGLVPYCSRYMSDRSERLTRREVEDLRDLLQVCERKFPQVIFSVLMVNLGEEVSIAEYAFWFANHAQISSRSAVGPRNWDLLLIIDPQGRSAALITGYALEPYVGETDLKDALAVASQGFHANDLHRGIRDCIEFMMTRLREIVLRVEAVTRAAEKPAAAIAANAP